MAAMANIYANLINKGKKTIEDVPGTLLAEVKSILGITDDAEEMKSTEENTEEETFDEAAANETTAE